MGKQKQYILEVEYYSAMRRKSTGMCYNMDEI